MTMTRGGFSRLLMPGFRKVIFDSYRERPIEGKALVNSLTSKRAYEEDFYIGGFGPMELKPEGGPIKYQDIPEGNVKRYTFTTYAMGFRITREMMDDDLYGIFGNKLSKAMGRSGRLNQEVVMASPFNNAFSTSYPGFVTGEALIGNHTLLNGSTIRNAPLVAADLDLISLQAAMEYFHTITDEQGMPTLNTPSVLVHSMGDYWTANQLLKSQFLPGGNQNDINQIANEGIRPHLSHFLTDPDAWFIMSADHDINYWERRPFTISNTDDFDTEDAKFKATRRNGAGWGDWRGIYGSTGA